MTVVLSCVFPAPVLPCAKLQEPFDQPSVCRQGDRFTASTEFPVCHTSVTLPEGQERGDKRKYHPAQPHRDTIRDITALGCPTHAACDTDRPSLPPALTEGDTDASLGEFLDHLVAPLYLWGQGDNADAVQGPVGGKQVLEGIFLEGADAVLWVCPLFLLADEWSFQVSPCSKGNRVIFLPLPTKEQETCRVHPAPAKLFPFSHSKAEFR